jgi:hypothetical protein
VIIRWATIKGELAQNLSKLSVPRMTQTRVPQVGAVSGGEGAVAMNTMNGGGMERVQVARGVTSEQNRRREEILDGKVKGIKFHRHPVITC